MDLKNLLVRIDPNIAIFLLTALCAFLSWVIKGLIETPLIESKKTFNRYVEKRIAFLTEIKTRLNFIAYFHTGEETLDYKNQIQQLLLRDGQPGYLNKLTFDSVMKISIEQETNEELLFDTIRDIDIDLHKQISKIQDEIAFYYKFSNYQPLKRFTGYALLAILYFLIFAISISFFISIGYAIITAQWMIKIVLLLFLIVAIYFINFLMKK